MAKIFPFDPHEAASRAEAARREAARAAAIAAEAARWRQEGELAALREREADVRLRNELAAEEEKDRKERVRAAMERRPAPTFAPSTPLLPDPNSFVGIKVMWGEHMAITVERLRDLARLASRWSQKGRWLVEEAARRNPASPPLNIRKIAEHDIIGTVRGLPDIGRKNFRGAVAWFVLNVDDAAAANVRANLYDSVLSDGVKAIFLTVDEDGERLKSIALDLINPDAPLSTDATGNAVPPAPPLAAE